MSSPKHAQLGASSAHRWMNCAGSNALIASLPPEVQNTESEYAREGTAAHKMLAHVLSGESEIEDWETVDGFEVTEDMSDAVRLFRDQVWERAKLDPKRCEILVEQRVSLADLNPRAPMFGTADCVIWIPRMRRLVVMDFKYGQGVVVEVRDNPQLQYYVLGALLQFERENPSLRGRIREIEMVVVQPRAFHPDGVVRSDTLSYEDVVGFATQVLDAADRTLEPDAPLNAGEWCRFCPAAPVCPALKDQTVALAQYEFSEMPANLPPDPSTLSLEELLVVMDKADLVMDWLKSVRVYVQSKLERGEEVPGWKLVAKRATRKWVDVAAATKYLVEVLGEAALETKLRSPAQIEKAIKRGRIEPPIPLDQYYSADSSGYNLVPESNPRPEVSIGPGTDFDDEPTL